MEGFWIFCLLSTVTGSALNNGESTPPFPVTTASADFNGSEKVVPLPPKPETVPDDYLQWFFYHSFKKLDEYFQRENEREIWSSEVEALESKNWKVRVSKVILKLILIICSIVMAVLFVLGVILFMIFSFLIFKFLAHVVQCCQEKKKRKINTTTYQVNV